MKKVIDNNGQEIEVSDDTPVRTIDGIHYLLTPEQEAEEVAKDAAWQGGVIARNALAEIQMLESQITQRRLREAILGIDNGWLANQEALITAQRAKL